MTRTRNASEFDLACSQIEHDYTTNYGRRIERLRAQHTDPPQRSGVDQLLEAHRRVFFIDRLLQALNWNLLDAEADGLGTLSPEVPVKSSGKGTIRYLDYLGYENSSGAALMIVEAKRQSAKLPKLTTQSEVRRQIRPDMQEVFARGLRGERLSGKWNEWLETLGDYTRSVSDRCGRPPERVVITNGDWLVAFLRPQNAFLSDDDVAPDAIAVYESWSAITHSTATLYAQLAYEAVTHEMPSVSPSQLAFVTARKVDYAMKGLRVLYHEAPSFTGRCPYVKVEPVVFVHSRSRTWLRVTQNRSRDYQVPDRYDHLNRHLDEVAAVSEKLANDIALALGYAPRYLSLAEHYAEAEEFNALKGVFREGLPGDHEKWIVLTGIETHFLKPQPSIIGCRWHDWQAANGDGYGNKRDLITAPSVAPRALFPSPQSHHCAHSSVSDAKAASITPTNRGGCGCRSGDDGHAFCEIFRFEAYLCCRACVFEGVCTASPLFRLPCQLLPESQVPRSVAPLTIASPTTFGHRLG